jgi:hypothetical protein
MNNERQNWRRLALIIVHCSLLLAGCGGGGNNGPEIAGLSGDRQGSEFGSLAAPEDLGPFPTEAHGALAALLPRGKELVKGSVKCSDWDQGTAQPFGDDPAKAALPTVQAMFQSEGYSLVVDDKKSPRGKGRAEVKQAQSATLILVRAPQVQAAEVVAERLRGHFEEKGLARQEPMLFGDGKTIGGLKIERYMRIDSGAEADSVYVAYMYIVGSVVVYAVETETPPPIKAADGTQAKRVLDGPMGARLGAQLVVQVLTRAAR